MICSSDVCHRLSYAARNKLCAVAIREMSFDVQIILLVVLFLGIRIFFEALHGASETTNSLMKLQRLTIFLLVTGNKLARW
jgi:hypothetical protein